MTETRSRPRSLPGFTIKLNTARGSLYVTVSVDEDGRPFEVFGRLGKGGSFEYGVMELACRLISLHLRRGTPLEEVIRQCTGIREMQPPYQVRGRLWPNVMPDGSSVYVLGLGDAIAHVLRYLQGQGLVKAEADGEERPDLKERVAAA